MTITETPVSADFGAMLDEISRAGLRRELRTVETIDGCLVCANGRDAVSFASCNYLGLAAHPRLAAAAARAVNSSGTSSGSARLLSGNTEAITALELELASYFRCPAALVMGNGYLANIGVITALAGRGDVILSDRLNHASTIDACRLSDAEVRVFEHNDVEDLRSQLLDVNEFRRAVIVVEGVYSMDGDRAPLEAIVEAAEEVGAVVVVDDAHGLGAVGPDGRGSCADAGVEDRVAVQIGNLGKGLGAYGAFVLTDHTVRELLLQTCRPFIFSCSLPPAVVAAAREGIAVLFEDSARVTRLAANSAALREELRQRGVEVPDGDSPIVPVVIGDSARAVEISERLLERGWLVPSVRPPSVPSGTARLRLTVTAIHTLGECRDVAAAVAEELNG